MFVIDYPNIHEKLKIGDRILVDYGGAILTVIGFENEDKYLNNKEKKDNVLESSNLERKFFSFSPMKNYKRPKSFV